MPYETGEDGFIRRAGASPRTASPTPHVPVHRPPDRPNGGIVVAVIAVLVVLMIGVLALVNSKSGSNSTQNTSSNPNPPAALPVDSVALTATGYVASVDGR